MTRRQRQRIGHRGFTLVEVMLALGILFTSLVLLIKSTAENIATAHMAHGIGVATELARGKMYDIEEELLHEGFQELDQSLDGDFSDEDWPDYTWEAEIVKIELPAMSTLEAFDGEGTQEGEAGSGAPGESMMPGGAMGGLLGMAGGMGGGDASGMATGSFIASQFELFSQVLEASIRKVTLTVRWEVMGSKEHLNVVCYFTDPAAMKRVIATGGAPTSDDKGEDDSKRDDDRRTIR